MRILSGRNSFIAFFVWGLLVAHGCGPAIQSVEKQQNIVFTVNDPDASYFNVHERMTFLKTANVKTRYLRTKEFDCAAHPIPPPVDYYLVMPSFYGNTGAWRKANEPLEKFERYITNLAVLYVTTADDSYAKCLANGLNRWAEKKSLLSYDYTGNHGQAWFAIEWTTASAGMAYSIIRDNPSLDSGIRRNVEAWLKEVAQKQIGYPGGPTSCCNNHSYWRGLEAAIVGVVTNDDGLFRFGVEKYAAALSAMNGDGSFPLEMRRGRRALHYQNFAILPLVYIAETAARQGYDLYGLNVEGKSLHLAIDFLMRSIQDIAAFERRLGSQDLSFLSRTNSEMNWMEPYIRRFPNEGIAGYLASHRPVRHQYGGGDSTLYYYVP